MWHHAGLQAGTEVHSENLQQSVPRRGNKHKQKRRDSSSSDESISGDPVKEFVREDVYLMENKSQRINTNLLANSLRARLRHSVPENVNVGQVAMNKLRRESLRNFVYLDNLHKQYTNEMNWESNRLDKESNQLVRRHHHLKKHSEQQKKNQEKLESQLRTRSGFSSVSLLPRLVDSSASTIETPVPEKDKNDFSDFAFVDKEDSSFVKVFKYKGIFQRQNKYGNRNDLDLLKSKQSGATAQDGNDDSDSPVDLPYKSKSRKGLSVTWSSQSQYYTNAGNSDLDSKSPSRCDTRTETLVSSLSREINNDTPDTTISMKSVKSDTFMWRKPKYSKGKSNIDTIGLKWQVPAERKLDKREKQPRNKILHVRNLNPVTKALDREGRSPSRMKWQVHQVRSPSAMDMYLDWIEKLDNAKRSPSSMSRSPDLKPRRTSYVKMPAVSVHM